MASDQADDEQPDERGPEQDRASTSSPPTLRTTTASAASADHDDRVDDALDDDRAQDRRAADPLPLAQRVAPDELAEARRQDVVGEVAEIRVAEHAAVRTAAIGARSARQRAAAGRDVEEDT